MEYKRLGKCGVKVSEICLGTMDFGSKVDEENAIKIVKRAVDLGINFIDTANVYNNGKSEEYVGKIENKRNQGAPAAYNQAINASAPYCEFFL
ncbi:MAG: aldo/keto reductase, partial [Nitrososphaeria archaeon]|nr:aldo/keto reductase [Nitrososphaeria archaeon]